MESAFLTAMCRFSRSVVYCFLRAFLHSRHIHFISYEFRTRDQQACIMPQDVSTQYSVPVHECVHMLDSSSGVHVRSGMLAVLHRQL